MVSKLEIVVELVVLIAPRLLRERDGNGAGHGRL
jgi:hypothetical protein